MRPFEIVMGSNFVIRLASSGDWRRRAYIGVPHLDKQEITATFRQDDQGGAICISLGIDRRTQAF